MTPDLTTLVADQIASRVDAIITDRDASRGAARLADEQPLTQLDLWRAYTAREAGTFLGLSDKAVYAIPESRLARHYTGSTGTQVRYLGINLLMHLTGQSAVDTTALAGRIRERFLAQAEAPVSITRASRPPAPRSASRVPATAPGAPERHRIL